MAGTQPRKMLVSMMLILAYCLVWSTTCPGRSLSALVGAALIAPIGVWYVFGVYIVAGDLALSEKRA